MTKLFGLVGLIFLGFNSYGQDAPQGTYQLMTTNLKAKEVFSSEILSTIESERLPDEVKVIKIGDFTWVRILSENTVNSPNFTPLSDQIISIDPDDEIIQIGTTISNHGNN